MESPIKVPNGWTVSYGESSTAEKKRGDTNMDAKSFQPTPPRTQNHSHLPTPETLRRSSRRIAPKPTQPLSRNTSTTSSLPTPQTLPRTRSKVRISSANPAESSQTQTTSPLPSPNGHTTFFHSNTINTSQPISSTRRPGLTFAQQMGLLAQSQDSAASGAASFGGRLGAGVGMGGHRSVYGKGDRAGVTGTARGVSTSKVVEEDNPFLDTQTTTMTGLTGLRSPGMSTRHRPRLSSVDSDTTQTSPLAPPKPKAKHIQTQLSYQQILPLTPPPTKHKNTHRSKVPPPTNSQPQIQTLPLAPVISEKRKRMLDTANNPFLSSPSSSRTHRPRYDPVDETRDTVTYVFRGSKKVFANPFLGMERGRGEAELDVEDEEFEADQCPRPRLLWPTRTALSTPGKGKGRSSGAARAIEEEVEEVTPPSSPVPASVVTPRGGGRGRKFSEGGLGGMDSPGVDVGPGDVFSESEGEFLVDTRSEEDSDDDDEGEGMIPVRRGLLFGGNGTVSGNGNAGGMKRALEDENAGSRKARKVMRI